MREFAVVHGFRLLRALLKATKAPASFATATWYPAAPIRWGGTAVRYSLVTVDPPSPASEAPKRPDRHADDLRERLVTRPLRFNLAVQSFTDEESTPIEDATVDWPTPYVTVARPEIPASIPGRSVGAGEEGRGVRRRSVVRSVARGRGAAAARCCDAGSEARVLCEPHGARSRARAHRGRVVRLTG